MPLITNLDDHCTSFLENRLSPDRRSSLRRQNGLTKTHTPTTLTHLQPFGLVCHLLLFRLLLAGNVNTVHPLQIQIYHSFPYKGAQGMPKRHPSQTHWDLFSEGAYRLPYLLPKTTSCHHLSKRHPRTTSSHHMPKRHPRATP